MKTFNIIEAAAFLGAHKETIRRLAAGGQLPGVKVGRSWRFIQDDLVVYMRSKYASAVTSQGAVRSNQQWHFTKEIPRGGLVLPIMDKEYREALGLAIK